MERKTAKEFLQELKERDLVSYLASLGYHPAKPPHDYQVWYCSPLRDEKTPSFKVDAKKNCWYDHGEGIGGNLIDFAIRYHNCTVGEFMTMMRKNDVHIQLPQHQQISTEKKKDKSIHILQKKTLFSYPLLNYLKKRRIDIRVADQFCKEVLFKTGEREYYGIGFLNNSGGYEIRNPVMKSASFPKDITLIENGSKTVHVFEGFFDFLTFATIFKNQPQERDDFLILNSTALKENAAKILPRYDSKLLYLDNDPTGDKATLFLSSSVAGCADQRVLYSGYNDLNEWHCMFGNHQHDRQAGHVNAPPQQLKEKGASLEIGSG